MDTDLLDQAFMQGAGGSSGAGGGRRMAAIILLVVLVLGAGGLAYWFVVAKHHAKTVLTDTTTMGLGTQTYELADGHYLQVGLSLQLTNVSDSAEITKDMPRIDNAIVFAFGAMTSTQMESNAGKQLARTTILHDVNQILGLRSGLPQVAQVYYVGAPLVQ
jgi:flagellar basal body-associated protein FliL